jgi:hypothetical protein
MSEYFRAAAASGWQPRDREVLRHHGLASALVREREEQQRLPPRDVLLQDAGEAGREALRARLASHVTDLRDAEVETAAEQHRVEVRQKQRLSEMKEAELRALQQIARDKAASAAAAAAVPARGNASFSGRSATPKAGGVPRVFSPVGTSAVASPRPGSRPSSALSIEQRRRLRAQLGSSFLFESDDEDEEAQIAKMPKSAADDVIDYSRPKTGASNAAGFKEAAAELSQLNVDDVMPDLVFAGAGAAAVARRHRLRPKSSLTRKALDATLQRQIRTASGSRPSSAAVPRVAAATPLPRSAARLAAMGFA